MEDSLMKIGDIDKNLAVESKIGLTDVVWFDSKDAPIKVYGLTQVEKGKQFLRFIKVESQSYCESNSRLL